MHSFNQERSSLLQLHEDPVCLYATVTWLGTCALMLSLGLAIAFRKNTRALVAVTLPAAVASTWVLDTAAHLAAAATGSRALDLDPAGQSGDLARALTVGAMSVALMTGSVLPVRLGWGVSGVAALSAVRLLAMAAHVAADAGAVEWRVVAGVLTGLVGASATLFLIRPETGEC